MAWSSRSSGSGVSDASRHMQLSYGLRGFYTSLTAFESSVFLVVQNKAHKLVNYITYRANLVPHASRSTAKSTKLLNAFQFSLFCPHALRDLFQLPDRDRRPTGRSVSRRLHPEEASSTRQPFACSAPQGTRHRSDEGLLGGVRCALLAVVGAAWPTRQRQTTRSRHGPLRAE